MESARIIDLEALLRPVAEGKPAGDCLRDSGTYDAIKNARRADDNLNRGEWQRETKAADWATASRIAIDALTSKTKDLQIAAWLTEALVNQYGFVGLRDGLDLLTALQERYWDALFPQPEDGDIEARVGVIEWLNDKLPEAVAQIAITVPTDKAEAYSFLRYTESHRVEGLKSPELRQAAIAEGKITADQFDKSVAAGSRKFYEDLFANVRANVERSEKLAALVDEKFGKNPPSLIGLKKAIEDCADLIEAIVKKKREVEPDPPAPEVQANGADPHGGGVADQDEGSDALAAANSRRHPVAMVQAPIATAAGMIDRTEALRQLQTIAEYFQRTEPHSPVSYLVQRAVKWGQMPLEKWLTDVISDEGVLTRIRETLGIKDS